MIARRSLLVLALVAGAVAGALYYIGAQRVSMIVAAQDVGAIRPLTADDLAVRSVPPDALPAGAISSVDEAIGRVPIAPLWQGQPLVTRALAADAAVFHTGLTLRSGERAVAIPVWQLSQVWPRETCAACEKRRCGAGIDELGTIAADDAGPPSVSSSEIGRAHV